jgi:oligopeptide transport system substrate-binding protein
MLMASPRPTGPSIKAAILGCTLLVLTACGTSESNVAAGNRDGILHIGNGTEPQSIDPHVMSGSPEVLIARTLYEGLVRRNPWTLAIEPGVAQRWEASEDGKAYTFYLNPDARWSNGDPVTAVDFDWSLRRSLHPKMGNQLAYTLFPIRGARDYANGQETDPAKLGIEVLDAHTLRIHLENPDPFFLPLMATYPTYPVHRATVEAHGKATDRFTKWTRVGNFVGNGPFTLAEWQLNRRLAVTRNGHYWDADRIGLNGVIFHPIENASAEEKMFRSGQLHYTATVPLARIPWYQQFPDNPYQQAEWQGTYFLMFNTTRSPFDDARVRMALAMAIDRAALVNKVLGGTEKVTTALVPPHTPGYDSPDIFRYDPAEARRLLAAAGYPDGRDWPPVEYIFNTSENHRKLAVAIQQMWKDELNIRVTLANQEWKVYLDSVDEKNYDIARMGWIASDLDPATFLLIQTTDSGINRTGWSNTRYDEIMNELAPSTADPGARSALMHEAETILMNAMPLIPLYTYNSKHLVQPSVQGAPTNVLDILDFTYISLDPDIPVWTDED